MVHPARQSRHANSLTPLPRGRSTSTFYLRDAKTDRSMGLRTTSYQDGQPNEYTLIVDEVETPAKSLSALLIAAATQAALWERPEQTLPLNPQAEEGHY